MQIGNYCYRGAFNIIIKNALHKSRTVFPTDVVSAQIQPVFQRSS